MTRRSSDPGARAFLRRAFRGAAALWPAAAIAVAWSANPAWAQIEVFDLAVGRFETPSLSALTCDDVETVVARIDALGYREIGPVPPESGEARRLYDYESAVIRMANERCAGASR